MTDQPAPMSIQAIESYHAHVYFDGPEARQRAEVLRDRIAQRFPVQMGRWRDQPVGPHPTAMYQVAFEATLFPSLVPWLMLNRQGLTIVVHPNTDRPKDDHLVHALWLGAVLPLDGTGLEASLSALGRAQDEIMPNTTPALTDI
ncbi:MAG TPA: DOPA 4,5-dioxygenase family protein [Aliidongia sp.]|uniref:DOPA 4,5-dioxygenase family protein n=1 Tax=Aliidongia sp. TaxID=1914230 RepID=UPI002DDD79F0|nr:DOPA 4,5-dioxygenase family protein [Aliidongia sp.]HEV2677949.1 DOPA 4,5-dioxygenase family protein [Aliidongia sp.]